MLFECEDLNLIYDLGKEVQTYALRNINLSISNNKLIGIMGPSGSGKSSLLYSLAGLKPPTTGTVKYKGIDLNAVPSSELSKIRKQDFGFIFQRHFLIDYMTVLDNVLVSINDNSTTSREKALCLLDRMGIKHLYNKKPYQLSGGQGQRVAIARALMNDPKVIFADELTAALDHTSAREVMKILSEYTKKAMVIVVTHDPSILENADEVINIWDGTINSIENKKLEVIA